MPALDHPAAREEHKHLTETLALVAVERDLAEDALAEATSTLGMARRFDPDALPVREMLYARAEQAVRNLSLAKKKPYFTRVDFTERDGEPCTYYIGKYGVLKSSTLEPVIIDWRSPIANLYYSGQIGPMHYEAPDGRVEGDLTLKRQIGIENGELKTIFDTDVVSQDAYLQSVLGAMSSDRLREIVTTIQAEQNFVIRHPLNVSLVVQGVAGSGKTTIALHRIAYLLYAFSEKLRPEHMLILAPNPLFLNFIAGVLPDLGVERVMQTTFPLLAAQWMGGALPKLCERAQSDVANLPDQERERIARVSQAKGSLRMDALLEDFMNRFEDSFPPEGDVKYGPVTLFTNERLRHFLLIDEKPFTLARRQAEFKKELTRRVKASLAKIEAWLREETTRRAEHIAQTMPDGEARRERLVKLFHSRDERIEESKANVKPFIKETMARFPSLAPLDLYRRFWKEQAESGDIAMREAAQDVLSRKDKRIEPEDIAALGLIAMRLEELPRLDIRHVVADEAQDFSPLEFLLISRMTRGATMTIVGDLMQGIKSWRGMRDWKALTDELFGGKAVRHDLVTSYRNTVEIMRFALRAAKKHPTPDQREAKPVLRHGPEPELIAFRGFDEQAETIARLVEDWRANGLSTIAVIERGEKRVQALAKRLPESLGARVLDVNEEGYEGGLSVAEAASVKGFEFDGVIVADAGEARYPDRELDARVLYVCLTRPLHRLACLYDGKLTPLLAE